MTTTMELLTSPRFVGAATSVLAPPKGTKAATKAALREFLNPILAMAAADFSGLIKPGEGGFDRDALPRMIAIGRMVIATIQTGALEAQVRRLLPEMLPKYRSSWKKALEAFMYLDRFFVALFEQEATWKLPAEDQVKRSLELAKQNHEGGIKPRYVGSFAQYLDN